MREADKERISVTQAEKTRVENEELAMLFRRFADHLKCWRVGIRYGSAVYFELGQRVRETIGDTSSETGSFSILFEGYEWVILIGARVLATSEKITREVAEGTLQKYFKGQSLWTLRFDHLSQTLEAVFSGNLRILSQRSLDSEHVDDSLCLIVLPDGKLISCDPLYGFTDTGSVSTAHARKHSTRRRAPPRGTRAS